MKRSLTQQANEKTVQHTRVIRRPDSMNREEQVVEEYLGSEGYTDIEFEPDGNVPPDFVLGGSVAVEVRRLNQQYETEVGPKGLEEDEVPILMAVRRALASLGPPTDSHSWFVGYRLRRPVASSRQVRERVRAYLQSWVPEATRDYQEVAKGITVRVIPAAHAYEQKFALGWTSDWDSGGWVISEIVRNMRLCVEEKTRKVKPHISRYSEWWLALVDYIGYGLNELDRGQLRGQIIVTEPWSRIIVVNPLSPHRSFDANAP